MNIHGLTGFLSNVGDIEDMAKNAIYILQDENLPAFKAAALERAKDFSVDVIVPQYVAYYEEIIEQVKVSI